MAKLDKADRKAFEDYLWKHAHADYRGVVDGKKAVLYYEAGRGTVLGPLENMSNEVLVALVALDKWAGHKKSDGLAKRKGIEPRDFDLQQLGTGILVELEHTSDPALALEISLDNMAKYSSYYERLVQAGL